MKFVVDECVGPAVARWLSEQGHDVFSVYDQARGMSDEDVIATSAKSRRILITNDKDFGEKVYRDRLLHSGVILLRLANQSAAAKVDALSRLLSAFADRIAGSFTVVAEKQVRFGKPLRLTLDQ